MIGGRRLYGPSQAGWRGGSLRRGESDGTGARTRRATGEALLVPPRKRRSTSCPITRAPGKWVADERVAEGPGVCAGQRRAQVGWSPTGARMEGAISEGEGNVSLASVQVAGEGRVSTARWNPKGMRRSSGPQSMGAIPTMNRSAKEGARSSRHYGDEGVIHPPLGPRCVRAARSRRARRDPRRSHRMLGVQGASGEGAPISPEGERAAGVR